MQSASSKMEATSAFKLIAGCALVALLALSSGQPAKCQFFQPQSHLSRLVQSITSPLVLSSSLGGGGDGGGGGGGDTDPSGDAFDPDAGPAAHSLGPLGAGPADGSQYSAATSAHLQQPQSQSEQFYQQDAGQHYQHYERQPQAQQAGHQQQQNQADQYYSGARLAQPARSQQVAALQQAPSQQRAVPQYYGPATDGSLDDEDSGAPTNQHGKRQRAASAANEQYQMGAYLGPTIDDKEIQGAFNSNDDRDDDEGAGYEGPPGAMGGGGGRQRAASSALEHQQESVGAGEPGTGYGPMAGGHYGASGNGERANYDDESSADEDDEPAARRAPRFKSSSGLKQAASQYHQRQNGGGQRGQRNQYNAQYQQQQNQQQPQPLMAAANGFAPMGSGPFDLSGLMGGGSGGNTGQSFDVYNGDGSYPGYYPQQGGNGRNGRQNQAASMNSPYGYNQNNYDNGNGANGQPQQQQQQQRGNGADNDGDDGDGDDD